jgi:hypothetical protein
MSFQPILPMGGLAGWSFLQRTLETQQRNFDNSAANKREIEYFKANIAKADTAEKLVQDRTLLKVALGAFGLDQDIDKRAYIRKVLEEGTEAEGAMANRLVDRKYREFAASFGYGDAKGAQVGRAEFVEQVVSSYRIRQFEVAVGDVDNAMRLALNFEREAGRLMSRGLSDEGVAFALLGDRAMNEVVKGALNLPREFSSIELDRQAELFIEGLEKVTGMDGVSGLADPAGREKIIRRFLLREQIAQGPGASTPGYAALQLFQASGFGANAAANLFRSSLL